MKPVTVHAAKTNLSRLIARACAGEDVVIARGKVPVVRLVPVATQARPDLPVGRVFGAARGLLKVDDAFFDPLPADELARWEGRGKNLGGMEKPPKPARRKGK